MEESEIKPDAQEKDESLAENASEQNINNVEVKNAESNTKNDSVFKRVLSRVEMFPGRFNGCFSFVYVILLR